jgi:hypothetical protein
VIGLRKEQLESAPFHNISYNIRQKTQKIGIFLTCGGSRRISVNLTSGIEEMVLKAAKNIPAPNINISDVFTTRR